MDSKYVLLRKIVKGRLVLVHGDAFSDESGRHLEECPIIYR